MQYLGSKGKVAKYIGGIINNGISRREKSYSETHIGNHKSCERRGIISMSLFCGSRKKTLCIRKGVIMKIIIEDKLKDFLNGK